MKTPNKNEKTPNKNEKTPNKNEKTPNKNEKTPGKISSKTPKKVTFDQPDEEPKQTAVSSWGEKKEVKFCR